MLFSIIVPTCNRYEALRQCLFGLSPAAQKTYSDPYEIIVTDDSPDDLPRTRGAVEFPQVQWLPGPRRGPASNRNHGAKAARGQWLIFIDDDILPHPNLLTAYCDAIAQNPATTVLEGATLEETPQTRLDQYAPINTTGGYLLSCNMAIRRDLFFELDGFCELFPYAAMEDVDLHERLKQQHHRPLFVPQAAVIHPWREYGPDDAYRKALIESHVIFYRLHPQLLPTASVHLTIIARLWIKALFIEGPRQHYRGFPRYLRRLITITRIFIAVARQH